MSMLKKINFVIFGSLISCSFATHLDKKNSPQEVSLKNDNFGEESVPSLSSVNIAREIASIDANLANLSKTKIEQLISKIFFSYYLGQTTLKEFDEKLNISPENILESEEYYRLLAIRKNVTEFEDNLNDVYLHLVMIKAHNKYSDKEKENAQEGFKLISDFIHKGVVRKSELSRDLKYLVLGNLRQRQAHLHAKLFAIQNKISDKKTFSAIEIDKALIHQNSQHKNSLLSNYAPDMNEFNQIVSNEFPEKDFNLFKKQIYAMAQEIKESMNIFQGRETSSDVIFPAAGEAGNISGNKFPQNTWSLTFDDGPSGKTTPTVLKNLADKKMTATFFVLGNQVESQSEVAQAIVDANMDVASHSYDHPLFTKLTSVELDRQISGAKKIIELKLDKTIKLFRLPYGAGVGVAAIREKIAKSNMIHVFWTVDTLDWQDKNPTSIFNRTVKQMAASKTNSGIILFHDIHSQSVTASALVMDYLKEKKLIVCNVQSVIDQINKGLESCN